jgi:hypothetical protein
MSRWTLEFIPYFLMLFLANLKGLSNYSRSCIDESADDLWSLDNTWLEWLGQHGLDAARLQEKGHVIWNSWCNETLFPWGLATMLCSLQRSGCKWLGKKYRMILIIIEWYRDIQNYTESEIQRHSSNLDSLIVASILKSLDPIIRIMCNRPGAWARVSDNLHTRFCTLHDVEKDTTANLSWSCSDSFCSLAKGCKRWLDLPDPKLHSMP